MKTWIYCDNCQSTRPLAGMPQFSAPGDWGDLKCAFCHFVIATISAGDEAGNPPPGVQVAPPVVGRFACEHCGVVLVCPGVDTMSVQLCASCGEASETKQVLQ